MLARAFSDSPLFKLAFPRSDRRSKVLRKLFAIVVKDAVRFGRVDFTRNGAITGMLIWYPPGAYPMSLMRIFRFLPNYLSIALAHPVGVFTLFRAQSKLNELRPKRPHVHGYFLGGRQGEQIGRKLIAHALRETNERGWPIYLETQEQRALKLYARFGFRVLQAGVETPAGGPLTWTMWREPDATPICADDGCVLVSSSV